MKMPVRYVVEMFIDRVAASKNYMKEKYTNQAPLEYYEKGAARLGKMIHPETASFCINCLRCWQKREKRRPVLILENMY